LNPHHGKEIKKKKSFFEELEEFKIKNTKDKYLAYYMKNYNINKDYN
jgi:hypothetical protein